MEKRHGLQVAKQESFRRRGACCWLLFLGAVACTGQVQTPTLDGGFPNADGGSVPSVEGGTPAEDGGLPVVDGGMPSADSGLPFADGGFTDAGQVSLGDARISVLSYAPQYALVADGEAAFQIFVSVSDGDGNPLPGVEIQWQSDEDSAEVSAPSTTDGSGLANGHVTSTVAGRIPVFASVSYEGESLDLPSVDLPFLPCHSVEDQFLSETYGAVFTRCLGCHNEYGLAKSYGLNFQLKMPGDDDFAADNVSMLSSLAEPIVSVEGGARMMSRLLAKPLGIADEGHMGGTLFDEGDPEHRALQSLVHRLQTADSCESSPSIDLFADVDLRTPRETYARAKLTLTGEVATPEELLGMANTEAALDQKLNVLMNQDAFADRLQEIVNDWLLTEGERNIINRLPRNMFPRRTYFNAPGTNRACTSTSEGGSGCCLDEHGEDFCNAGRRNVSRHITSEPLELISWIVKQNRSLKEILTYDQLRVSPFTAYTYGVDDLVTFPNPYDDRARRPIAIQNTDRNNISRNKDGVRAIPHSGILTTQALLQRFPATESNRQRTRAARVILERFLAVPVGEFADFLTTGLDPNADLENATQTTMPCIVCHTAMDPIAGNFNAFRVQGAFTPNRPWPDYLPAPAFGDEVAPENTEPLPWLAAQVAEHPRFAYGVLLPFFAGITGAPLLSPPKDLHDENFAAKSLAFRAQNEYLTSLKNDLMSTHNYRMKPVLKAILKGPYFRAKNASNSGDALQDGMRLAAGLGGGIALTNELLDRKLLSLTGFPWRRNGGFGTPIQLDRNIYGILYGGIDSDEITQRFREPFALQLGIIRRMANEMSCMAIPRDFSLTDADSRRLLPSIEQSTTETTDPQGIRNAIRRLLHFAWGEDVEVDGTEVEQAYQLFVDARAAGLAAIESGDSDARLPVRCRVTRSYAPGNQAVSYPANPGPNDAHRQVIFDNEYTVRSWMAVFTYILSDPKFFQD